MESSCPCITILVGFCLLEASDLSQKARPSWTALLPGQLVCFETGFLLLSPDLSRTPVLPAPSPGCLNFRTVSTCLVQGGLVDAFVCLFVFWEMGSL